MIVPGGGQASYQGHGGDLRSDAPHRVGDGRIFWGGSGLTQESLTLTAGYAKAVDGKTNSDRGGAVYGGVNATNCLFIGNKADGYGGAVASGVVARDCRFVNNSCPYGVAGFRRGERRGDERLREYAAE